MAGPMCPWCGDEADDTPEEIAFAADESCETDCGGCGKPITIFREIYVEYSCEKRDVK